MNDKRETVHKFSILHKHAHNAQLHIKNTHIPTREMVKIHFYFTIFIRK